MDHRPRPDHARIRDAERRLASATDTGPVHALARRGSQLRREWEQLGLDRRHAIIKALLDHAVITPGTPGAQRFDINRVRPRWRL